MNVCNLIGNSGSDPVLRYTPSKLAVLNLSVATSKKVKEEWKSTWHRVVVFGKQAEFLAHVIKKGTKLFVSGEIQNNEWTDKDGNKKSRSEILANLVYPLLTEDKPGLDTMRPPTESAMTEEDMPF